MPHFMIQASFTQQGIQGVLKEGGSARVRAVRAAIESFGGKFHAMYFAFGSDDVVIIAEGPDHIGQIAGNMLVAASGAVTNLHTTVLITAEEMDEATKRTGTYRPPGA